MIIVVQTFILSPDAEAVPDQFESEWFVNDDRPDGRARLARHARWAMRNGRSVTTFAKGV